MAICFKGHMLCFAQDAKSATQDLAWALLSAIQQSYPERLAK